MTIETEARGAVLHLRMSRPEKKNALTHAMYSALVEGFDRAESEDDLRVIVISGAGGNFTTGNDIGDFMSNPPADDDAPVLQFLRRLSRCEKPVVMAVEGLAIGVGATMLLHADVVVVSAEASFQMPFINLGLVPEAASSLLLPKVAGHKLAAEILMLGERFDAETARRAGLVTRIVAPGEAEPAARGLASVLAAKPPEALRLTKALIKRDPGEDVSARISHEASLFLERLGSDEARAAFMAFMNRGR